MRISDWSSDVCSSDLQRGDEGDAVLDAQLVVRIIGRVAEVGQIQRLAQAAELPVVAAGDDDVAVAGRQYLIGYDIGMRIAEACRTVPRDELVESLVSEHTDLAVEQPAIDPAALASPAPPPPRGPAPHHP